MQDEKGTTQNEMFGWHHWLDRHEFEQAQRSIVLKQKKHVLYSCLIIILTLIVHHGDSISVLFSTENGKYISFSSWVQIIRTSCQCSNFVFCFILFCFCFLLSCGRSFVKSYDKTAISQQHLRLCMLHVWTVYPREKLRKKLQSNCIRLTVWNVKSWSPQIRLRELLTSSVWSMYRTRHEGFSKNHPNFTSCFWWVLSQATGARLCTMATEAEPRTKVLKLTGSLCNLAKSSWSSLTSFLTHSRQECPLY